MYSLNRDLEQAWQALFDLFYPQLDDFGSVRHGLVFSTGEDYLRDPGLFIGQTCGYPLMSHLQDAVSPFCVPIFDVPGVEGRNYSSHIIVAADSAIASLEDCRGAVVAINNTDSNSGMNVLRHALARVGAQPGFFSRIELTGGHLHSLEAVAAKRADVAAIDCVSYQLIADWQPELVAAVRSLEFTAATCGLPFVVPRDRFSDEQCAAFTEAFNQALIALPSGYRDRLHLVGFETVQIDAYQGILELEKFAVEAGYPELN